MIAASDLAGPALAAVLSAGISLVSRRSGTKAAEVRATAVVEERVAQLRKDLNGHLKNTEKPMQEHNEMAGDMKVLKEQVGTLVRSQTETNNMLRDTNRKIDGLISTLLEGRVKGGQP